MDGGPPTSGLTAWCTTVASRLQPPWTPQGAEEPWQEDSWRICESVERATRSHLCGGDAFDTIRRAGGGTGGKGGKRARTQKANDRDLQKREESLVLDLPALQESYRILKGQSLGILKLAIHQESHQRRAVFTLPKRSIVQAIPPGSNDREEVLTHLQKLLKIDHVNVLALHEACEDFRFVHLVYDWPEGGLLLSHLTQYHSDVTEAHVASVIRETLAAVAAASRFSVYHHDWSLMCLFLGYKNRFTPIKVFGIGLAGVLVPLVTARKTSRANKYFYASPELLEDGYRGMAGKKLHACDIWSIGTLLYMLFSGRPPFVGRYDEAVEKIKRRHWTFGPEFDLISREAKDIIDKMLNRDWERRPSAADLLKHPFLGLEIGKRRQGGVVCQDALSKLDQFARETHCKQTLARLLADLGLQESAYSDLEDKFKQLDLDGNGVVEVTELEELGGQLNLPGLDLTNVASIIAACDRNDNGTIDISEFVSAVVLQLESKDERLLVKAFEKMDMNRDARITKGEIFRVLRQYSGSLDAADVSHFVSDMDKDTDQKVDYNEFKMLFPHMKEKDEEIKTRLRSIQVERELGKKAWSAMLSDMDKLFKALRLAAGKIALEHSRLQRVGNNEKQVSDRVAQLAQVLSDNFLQKHEAADQSKADHRHGDRRQHGLTGLNVMNLYNRESPVEAGASPAEEERSGRGHGSDSDDGPASPAAGGRRTAPAALAMDTDAGATDANTHGMSIARKYTRRALWMRGCSTEDRKAEEKRRRQYLWLGSGEGIKHVRAHLHRLPIKTKDQQAADLERASPRSDHSGGSSGRLSSGGHSSSPRSGGGSGADSPRSDAKFDSLDAGASPLARPSDAGSPTKLAGGAVLHDDEGHALDVGQPWTTNKKTLKHAMLAMELAKGPIETKIGELEPRDQRRQLKKIALERLASRHFKPDFRENLEQLCDLHQLLRYKVLKSWLPPLDLIQQEMRKSMDVHFVHMVARRNCYLNGAKMAVQLVERIMFSITEFIAWQEEGMLALFSLEDVAPAAPASKRFLPYRAGEVDEKARTPRDDEDAEELAPDEAAGAEEYLGAANNKSMVSFAEGELHASSMEADLGPGMMQSSFATSSRRFDRNSVRARRGPMLKGGGKGNTDARPKRHSAPAAQP